MDRSFVTSVRVGSAATAAGLAGAAWLLSKRSRRRRVERNLRYLRGRLAGWRYHLQRRHPETPVSDDVLTQRVRSTLGQTIKALDVPHVHVTVTHGIVLLHGEVGTDDEADTIEKTAHQMDGVDGVLSYLRVGLRPGTTRPSEGAQTYTPSPALRQLLQAVKTSGVPEPVAGAVVRAVIATFVEHLPTAARDHMLAHLPRDVQVLATPPRRHGAARRIRHVDDFIDAVLATDHLDPTQAREVITAALATLQALLPEESRHIEAVLPRDLRVFWPVRAVV